MERLRNFVFAKRQQPSDVLGENNRFTNSFDYHALEITKSLDMLGTDDFRLLFLTDANNIDGDYNNNSEYVFDARHMFQGGLVVVIRDRKLKVCDFKTGMIMEERSYPAKIVRAKMNRARLVVFLEDGIFINDIRMNKTLQNITLRHRVSEGLCDMAMASNNCLVAFPSGISGDGTTTMQLYDALNLRRKLEFCPYRQTRLKVVVFNSTGSQLITASSEGTTIDVFATGDGSKLYEFVRGMIPRDVANLAVSDCGRYVACTSQTRTIHIFKQEDKSETSPGYVYGFLTYYIPDVVKRHFDGPPRAHAWIYLPVEDVNSVVSFVRYKTKPIVVVTTSDGAVSVYPLDVEKGGQLRLKKKWLPKINGENAIPTDELPQGGINLLREENSGRPVSLERLSKLKLEDRV